MTPKYSKGHTTNMLLRRMWEENKEFQQAVVQGFDNLSQEDKIRLTKEYLLHIVSETDELLRATGKWKIVMQEEKPPNIPGIREEIIDKFKFLVNIALIWGISPNDFITEFNRKTDVNWQKFRQQTLPLEAGDKIAVFDLDGVLCKYPEFWLQYLQEEVPDLFGKDLIKNSDLHNLAPSLNRSIYEKHKIAFREQGYKQKIPVMEGACSITSYLRTKGFKIVILTRRPVQEYKRIYADTIAWLKKSEITFDGIYWSDGEKDNDLKKRFKNVSFVVEDDPEQATRLLQAEFKVFLLDRPYNQGLKPSPTGLTRIFGLIQIEDEISKVGNYSLEINRR